jgi:hypothetical protein
MKKLLTVITIFASTSVFAQSRFIPNDTIVDVEKTIDASLYSANVYVFYTDSLGVVPMFRKDTTVVSNNTMTGYQVDAQRNKAVKELSERVK